MLPVLSTVTGWHTALTAKRIMVAKFETVWKQAGMMMVLISSPVGMAHLQMPDTDC